MKLIFCGCAEILPGFNSLSFYLGLASCRFNFVPEWRASVLKCLEMGVVHQPGFPGWLWPAVPHPIPCHPCLLQVVGVPVGSALQSTVKQAVAISGGQILVAKSSSSVAKAVGSKQVVTQGVAKAIVSGGGGTIVAQPVQTITKAQVSSTGAPKSTSQGSGRVILHLVSSLWWVYNELFNCKISVCDWKTWKRAERSVGKFRLRLIKKMLIHYV